MRMHGHAAHDDMAYVPAAQLDEWRAKDPVARQERRLAELGVDLEALHSEVTQAVESGVQEALAMPMPDPATATEGVFATEAESLGDGRSPWYERRREALRTNIPAGEDDTRLLVGEPASGLSVGEAA